jgi:GT2 family glycosyltransferase
MKILRLVQRYVNRARQIVQDKGFGFLWRAILFKFRSRGAPERKASIPDWLAYYQKKAEARKRPALASGGSENPEVSILILTYNNLAVTQTCLYSIFANTSYPNFEIILVDNASSDETPAWLGTYSQAHSNVQVILNSSNRGFAAGNNQAAARARGKYLVFLNNDTVVTQGWLEGLLSHVERDPGIGLIGPVTNSTGNEARIPVEYSTPLEMERFAAERRRTMKGKSFDIRMLALYCVLTARDQFDRVGRLDERFGVGMFEDDDLAVRYHESGLRVVCAEDVFVHHFQSVSFGRLKKDHYDKIFSENQKKYEEKWGRPWQPYHFREELLAVQRPRSRTMLSKNKLGILHYRCNICGRACKTPVDALGRETPSCSCGSTVRSRAIIHLLSMELFGKSIALPDFPIRPDLRGWGMSDGGYAGVLAKKVGYVNTFYHQDPRFDITAPLDPEIEGTLDFLISTEVFEHITSPVSTAFRNARRLLKPGASFIFTVPYTLRSDTDEHFPELHQYEIVERPGADPILRNITRDGREQVFENLVFHGGPGSTLEMRVFAQAALLTEFKKAGFEAKISSEPCWEFGIYWRDAWSLPIVAHPILNQGLEN